ncbi:hypothetical protein ACFV0T_37235 [Streptomyces sp. NPDC059582]|uniref:hypothetical protein n=1 Tax=Streptomyces sp. NPDC059582 TaxID=3346875 RepID=UPI00369900EB
MDVATPIGRWRGGKGPHGSTGGIGLGVSSTGGIGLADGLSVGEKDPRSKRDNLAVLAPDRRLRSPSGVAAGM